ncbi:MAG: DUF5335 family protein [Thermoanaerobaculia bacterium]
MTGYHQPGWAMSATTRIPQDQLQRYFERFTKRFLRDDSPESVDAEIIAPDWGDQTALEGARLSGVSYDQKAEALEFAIEDVGDHRIYRPKEAWAIEESDGFISSVEIVRDDNSREVVKVKRS